MTSAILQCDGYKTDHRRQYPKNTIKVYTNFTPRKSRKEGVSHIINFGLTGFIKEFLLDDFQKTFFDKPKTEILQQYARRMKNYLPGNDMTYEHIEALHDLGYLPILIKALPEGAMVRMGVPILTITNTLSEFFWLPNFLESILSCEVWQMSTSATTAFEYRKIFDKFALETVGNTEFSSTFQVHDFSMRGQVNRQAAAKSGAAHLTSFMGTDTIPAIDYLETYYNANSDKEMVGISVPATEHSVMSMGMKDSEFKTFKRLINDIYPNGFISVVSDTWDFWNVVRPVTGLMARLKANVLSRDGRVVIRPDSGDPVKIITGYTDHELVLLFNEDNSYEIYKDDNGRYKLNDSKFTISEEERKGAIECLWEEFGGITNELGYKELDTHVGLIYGDSITLERASIICERLKDKGYASTNWVAGVGSYTYQYTTRDTYGWAMKATYGEVRVNSGYDFTGMPYPGHIESREIFKDPITDDGTKKSAKGLLCVTLDEQGEYQLTDQVDESVEAGGELKTVFKDGKLLIDPTLAEIRERINNNVLKALKQ